MLKLFSLIFSFSCLVGYAFSSHLCTNSSLCQEIFGNKSSCKEHKSNSTGVCTCYDFNYLTNTSCEACPGYGESCEVSQCCKNEYLLCIDNTCSCFWTDFCWSMDDNQRARLQIAAQVILAISLFLTAVILFILFWNACTRYLRALPLRSAELGQNRRVSPRDCPSLNSIQRLVLMQLQDSPPPYNEDLMSPNKNLSDILDPPPSYSDALQLPPIPLGEENLGYFSGDNPLTTQSSQDILQNSDTLSIVAPSNTVRESLTCVSDNDHSNLQTCTNPVIWISSGNCTNSSNSSSLQSTLNINSISASALDDMHI